MFAVGESVGSRRPPGGAEETPSTKQHRDAVRRGARARATEQKRDVHRTGDDDSADDEDAGGCGETAVPRGARANRRLGTAARGAGCPLSRMLPRTKDGLRPTHQPLRLVACAYGGIATDS